MKTTTRFLQGILAALVACAALPALAQGFPNKPIKLVVPYPPGGGTDVLARIIAPKLGEALGQPVIIDNKPGAGGTIGSAVAAKMPPDGYTLLILNTLPHTSSAGLYAKLSYDPVKDFAGIGAIATVPYVITLNPNVSAKNWAEFAALAKQGKLNYASAGTGSATHLAAEFLKAQTKLPMTHVPYKGGGPAIADLLGGQVDLTIENIASVIGHIKAGKLRAIAVTTSARSSILPELPTIGESGYPGFDVGGKFGIVVPAGAPPEIVATLSAALAKAVKSDEYVQKLREQGGEPKTMTPSEWDALMRAESAKWLGVISASGLKPE